VHAAVWQLADDSTSVVHARLSLHEVGQAPVPLAMPMSQRSPLAVSTTPLPHTRRQVALQMVSAISSPSSHCSGASTKPSPQLATMTSASGCAASRDTAASFLPSPLFESSPHPPAAPATITRTNKPTLRMKRMVQPSRRGRYGLVQGTRRVTKFR